MCFLGLLVVVGDRLRVVLASLRGGLAFPRREAGYSHLGDRSRSAGRRDIQTKPCFLLRFCSLGRPRVRVFGQRSDVSGAVVPTKSRFNHLKFKSLTVHAADPQKKKLLKEHLITFATEFY